MQYGLFGYESHVRVTSAIATTTLRLNDIALKLNAKLNIKYRSFFGMSRLGFELIRALSITPPEDNLLEKTYFLNLFIFLLLRSCYCFLSDFSVQQNIYNGRGRSIKL